MDEVIEFVRRYLKAEHAVRLSVNTDKSREQQDKKYEALSAFFADGVVTDITRPFDDERKAREDIQERPLFLVKEYQKGKLYSALVGNGETSAKGTTYDHFVFVVKEKAGLKVTALGGVCSDCLGSGKVEGKPCPECKKSSGVFVWTTGEAIDLGALGKPTAIKKLESPTHKRYKPDYDSIK